MIGELHVGDDLRLEQADRVAGDRISEAGMKLLGHRSAADDVARLDDPYLQTRFREIEGADAAVVAGPADDGVICFGHEKSFARGASTCRYRQRGVSGTVGYVRVVSCCC